MPDTSNSAHVELILTIEQEIIGMWLRRSHSFHLNSTHAEILEIESIFGTFPHGEKPSRTRREMVSHSPGKTNSIINFSASFWD